ncbi:IclR family transcriptional regulator [Cellulomonas sp. P24]|uniref:IclR family transcriptional regulator n=1 Tax=Cellulomonas sp. P24 TaxID=2885206 RepID=UPI00216B0279|nr:IclR family transcriptional regulator [Cellulomonas sp. P24]MCR6492382.1 IclR family transcriptional regulator [Cellulomonas sp. P24]
MTHEPTLIASVQRALHLLDAVGAADRPLPAKALARRTGQPLGTTYHLLRTLVHEGYLTRVEGLGYVLGDRIPALSAGPGRAATAVAQAHEVLQALHVETSAAAYLTTMEDGEIHLTDVVDSAAAPRVDLWVDFHDAAHATAVGKAILAALDESRRRDYLGDHALTDLTPHTVTDRRVLLRQLTTAGEFSVDREEYALGTACLAVAVPSTSWTGAVAMSVPVRHADRLLVHRASLRRAAREIAVGAVSV